MTVDEAFDAALKIRRPDVATIIYELSKRGKYPNGCDNFDRLIEHQPRFNDLAMNILRSIENAERNGTPTVKPYQRCGPNPSTAIFPFPFLSDRTPPSSKT